MVGVGKAHACQRCSHADHDVHNIIKPRLAPVFAASPVSKPVSVVNRQDAREGAGVLIAWRLSKTIQHRFTLYIKYLE